MFYSYESLVARNGKFALVWKLATSTNKRKLVSRSAILGVSVPELCDSLINMVPTGFGLKQEAKSKFSLYLLSQLMYGVVIVLEKQTAYLEIDIRSAYTATQNLHLNAPVEGEKHKVKKGIDGRIEERERKGKKRKHEEEFEYDIRNVPLDISNLDKVGVALHNQITLQDPLPPPPLYNQYLPLEDDLLPPTHEQLDAFQNLDLFSVVIDRQSSSSSEEKLQRMEIDEPFPLIEKPYRSLELPPFEPFPELPPLQELGPEGDLSLQQQSLNIRESTLIAPMEVEEMPEKEAPVPSGDKQADILPLEAAEVPLATPLSVKRRRPALRMADDVTLISWERVKDNQRDYSATVRSLEEIYAKPADPLDINNLFKPYPTWMHRPLNKELHELYKPWVSHKMTYEEAAAIDPNAPPTRGPESKLWRYEGSEEPSVQREFPQLDDDLRLSTGIAFIDSTPERAKNPEQSIYPGEHLAPLPPLTDMDDFEQRNQASDIEAVRRSTIGHLTADDETHKSSMFLRPDDPMYGMASFHQDSQVESTAQKERTKTDILSFLHEAGGAHCSFNAIFPVDSTTRKQAACAFTSVLELLKDNAISVQQDEPYGEIWIEPAKKLFPRNGSSRVSTLDF